MTDKRTESQFDAPVSPAPMDDAQLENLLNTKYKGLKGVDMSKVSSVSRPSRGDARPGTGKWDFGGGRIQVNYRTPEELGPRTKIKFDKNNPDHVEELKTPHSERMLHPGGYFSIPAETVSTAKTAAPKKAPKKVSIPTVTEDTTAKVDVVSKTSGKEAERAKLIADKQAAARANKAKGRAEAAAAEAKRKKLLGLE